MTERGEIEIPKFTGENFQKKILPWEFLEQASGEAAKQLHASKMS